MSEQLTFFPYWRRKFGEFEISSFAEHSFINNTPWNARIVFEQTFDENPPRSLHDVPMVRRFEPIYHYKRSYNRNTGYLTIERVHNDTT